MTKNEIIKKLKIHAKAIASLGLYTDELDSIISELSSKEYKTKAKINAGNQLYVADRLLSDALRQTTKKT